MPALGAMIPAMRKTALLLGFVALSVLTVRGQGPGGDPAAREAQQRALQDDHQDMMRQLGIRALRPGPSGTETAPNHANYDEATANPYPDLPPVLVMKNGKKVTTAEQWKQRRAEIIEDFDREVLGRVPVNAPKITWTVAKTENWEIAGHPVVGQSLIGHADNSAFPDINVDIQM